MAKIVKAGNTMDDASAQRFDVFPSLTMEDTLILIDKSFNKYYWIKCDNLDEALEFYEQSQTEWADWLSLEMLKNSQTK